MGSLVLLIAAVVLGLALLGGAISFNRFVAQRNHVRESWATIDTELRRRYDLIPNLVQAVKGYAAHEQQTLEAVIAARRVAATDHGSPEHQAETERGVVRSLRQLMAVAEAYPDLKANQHFLQLQAQLAETEDRIQLARRIYNANVRDLNRRVQAFPSNVVARLVGFEEAEYFQIDEAVRQAPNVALPSVS